MAGDRAAFAALIHSHQDMAFGYALSILGNYHAAEDAAQEAFVSVYFGLPTLRDPAAFPQWLRGIVRNACHRQMRSHRGILVPLDDALDLPDGDAGPDERAERTEAREQVLNAVMALPAAYREVVALYYTGDFSQREVAEFLGLPVTTVNNRLHAARQRLKGGLLPMVKDDFRRHAPSGDFADKIGRIIAVRGPVIEAQFAADSEPEILNAVTLEERLSLAVTQRLPDGRVRCIALTAPSDLVTGMDVTNSESIVQSPISPAVLRDAVAILVRPEAQSDSMVETGIKALDVLCPLPAAGTIALYGPAGAGKLAVLGEVLDRLSTGPEITLLNFTQTGPPDKMRPPGDEELPNASGRIETFYLPVDDSAEPSSIAVETVRDAIQGAVYMSRAMVLAGLYPSIDPLVSWSRVLTEEAVGREHVAVADQVRDVLQRAEAIREGNRNPLSPDDQSTLATADRIRMYLTQPFYVAEPYTTVPGEYVPVSQSISDCRAILSGRYNDLSVETFRFGGSLEQILARAS